MIAAVRAGFSPVKGMRHLDRGRVFLDAQGAVGDRAFCVVDPARARVLRTVQHPALLGVVAHLDDGVLSLTLPSGVVSAEPEAVGETLACDYWGRTVDLDLLDGPHAAGLGELLGLDVRLAAAPRGGVVFGGPVTVIGTASVRACAELVGQPWTRRGSARRSSWRPTSRGSRTRGSAARWSSGARRSASAARSRGVPSSTTTPITGARDLRLLKALTHHRPTNRAGEPVLGVYAECVAPGVVGAG